MLGEKVSIKLKKKLSNIIKDKYIKKCRKVNKIFILGFQKSGTTAIAALLSILTKKTVMLDLKSAIDTPEWKLSFKYPAFCISDKLFKYRTELNKYILKEPGFSIFYPELHNLYKSSKFVFVVRNPFDNIRSILNRLNIPGDLDTIDSNDYSFYNKSLAWQINLDSSWLGYQEINYIDSLAFKWSYIVRLYIENKNNIILIRYEDFVKDKELSIRELANKLHLVQKKEITTHKDHQYQKKGIPVSNYNDFFGNNFNYIMDHCYDLAKEIGYNLEN